MEVDEEAPPVVETSSCFGCAFSFLTVLLNFISETAGISHFKPFYLNEGFIMTLFKQNLHMFSSKVRVPASNALCKLIKYSPEHCDMVLKVIETSLDQHMSPHSQIVPGHMLSAVLH